MSFIWKGLRSKARDEDDASQPLNSGEYDPAPQTSWTGGGAFVGEIEMGNSKRPRRISSYDGPDDMSSLAAHNQRTDDKLYWTDENTRAWKFIGVNTVRPIVLPDLNNVEFGDLLLVFPRNSTDAEEASFDSDSMDEDLVPIEKVTEMLVDVMWKRAAPQDIGEGREMFHQKQTLKYISDVYDVKDDIDALPRTGAPMSRVQQIVRENVLRTLRALIVCDVKELEISTKSGDYYFYRVRLTEPAARQIADESEYLLQLDRRVAPHAALRNDPTFVPPYAAYEDVFEQLENVSCMKFAGFVWTRYDKLSRPMEVDNFDTQAEELSIFRDIDRVRLLLRGLDLMYNFEAMEELGFIDTMFVLHQPYNLSLLKDEWANFRVIYSTKQPLEAIRDYFGEDVGLYFAWLGFYTHSLRYPAAFGLILHILQETYDPQLLFDVQWLNTLRLLFSVFLIGWCTWFFYEWIRLENSYALKWGLETSAGFAARPRERRDFHADRIVKDPIEPQRWVRSYSKRKFKLRAVLANTMTVLLTLTCVISCNQTFHHYVIRYFFGERLDAPDIQAGEAQPYFYVLFDWLTEWIDIASWFTAILVKVFDRFFGYAVVKLVEFENHQFENDYLDALVLKVFFFKSLDYFTPLVYLAFFKHYVMPCEGESCLLSLRSQLMSIFLIDFVSNIFEVGQPAFNHWWKMRKAPPDRDPSVEQFEMEEYEDTVEDFEEMITQFGLVTLFSLVCPAVPLLACISNHAEIRVDAYKLAACHRRPNPKEVEDIGAWITVLQFMTVGVVIMNVALLVFATLGKHFLLDSKLLCCVVLLSIAFGVKEMVQHFWPNDTRDAIITRQRMVLVAHEAIWGEYSGKFDEKALALQHKKSKRNEYDQLYADDPDDEVDISADEESNE